MFDHTNGSAPSTVNGAAQRLNGQGNEIYGLARSLSVMPEDGIDLEVYQLRRDLSPQPQSASGNLPELRRRPQFLRAGYRRLDLLVRSAREVILPHR